ncbi:hypothetical protein E4U55_001955 [Claviceps digitariae]|nr:hypothetical protein E4U55_001955 [Claviceps digitariae]
MKLSLCSFLFLGSLVAGQPNVLSKSFNLVLHSSSKEHNGRVLGTCHEGDSIESICLVKDQMAVFNLNVTEGQQPGPGGLVGLLTWKRLSQPWIPFSMSFYINPASNVALPLLVPGPENSQPIAFDDENFLNIVSWLDDSRMPPSAPIPQVLKQWHICTMKYTSHTYLSLAWVLGKEKAQNQSCIKVAVKRRFIS